MTGAMSDTSCEIDLRNYTRQKFTALKLTPPAVEVLFPDKPQNAFLENQVHSQLKCHGSTYPFVKEGYKPIALPIKHATKLINADPAARIKEIIEIELDSSSLGTLDYSPGDTIAILPQNAEKEIIFLLEAIKLLDQADQICQVHPSSFKKNIKYPHIPEFTTPRELLRDILNIRAVLKKQSLRALADCCSSEDEQNFLNCLASKEGSLYYNELVLDKGLTLIDFLSICSSCKPTLPLLIEHLPRLLPRPYSIANSPITHEHELKIILSILNARPGVTTSMLASMVRHFMKGNIVPVPKIVVYPRKSNSFCYKNDDFENNQILIAIGTGVAPFLGFLEHKKHLLRKHTGKPGVTWLFVGGSIEAAIPHRSEMLEMMDKYEHQVIERYFESFSQVPDAAFHYIQEQIIAHAKELVEFLLQSQTTLYICADGARISQTIESNLCLCIQQELEVTADEAMKMLKDFRTNGKYREDLWL